MGITRPTGEQLRFRSATTGDHILDTYMENSEKGSRTLPDLMDDLFDSSGVFRSANFEFRFNSTDDKIQFRAGNFSNGNTGWTDVTTFFDITGTFNASTTYNNFDLLTLTNKDVYIVHGLSSGTTFADEAAVIASANTQKLVDVSEARDWASKTDGQVVSTDYSSKAYAVGGTGVDTTTGSAKDWAIKTSSTVGNTGEYSAKYWATSTSVTTVSSGIANINTVAAAIASVNTTAANISNVNTVAGISADVTTVANIDGNVTTVAGISADTTTVAGIAPNVTTVAGVATNVTTVAGIASNVTTVANNNTNVTTVATNVADLQTVADEIDNNNLQTVANDINAVVTAANDLNEATSEIDTVANSIANVDLVGGSIANVNTVATNIANVNTTATNIANVNTVAGISANVTTVAGISADVTTAATNNANITTVAGISGNVTTVAGISSNVTTVAGIAADVTTAATNVTAFNNTYLGAQSSAPTLDPDGSALDVGDLYFDTTSNTMKVYAQSGWVAAGSSVNGTADRFNYTATAGQTTFTGADDNNNTLAYDAGFADIYMNGVKLAPADYTASNGSSVVLASGAALNDTIEIIAYGTFVLADHLTQTQSDARYVQVAGDTMTGGLNITSGNVGIGVSASAWSAFNALEMSNGVYVGSYTGGTTAGYLGTNNYFNGSNFIYKNSDFATRYQQVDGKHQWFNAPSGTAGDAISFTQPMTLDASGNLLVGKTSSNVATAGHELLDYGRSIHTVNASTVQIINRLSNDGDMTIFQKDGSTVGSIGTSSNTEITLAGLNAGIAITANAVVPTLGIGLLYRTDNAIDLGRGDTRFKDLYLSGGVKVSHNSTVLDGIKGSNLGYGSGSYKVTQIGATAGTNNIALGVDMSGNTSGSFAGYGDIFVKNGTGLYQPNAANDDILDIMNWKDSETVFNDSGDDRDFRVESNNNANCFVLDANNDEIYLGKGSGSGTAIGGIIHAKSNRFYQFLTETTTNAEDAIMYLNRQSSDGKAIYFRRANSAVGNISLASSGTTYNTTSDRRLKDNIEPIANGTEKLMAMKPVTHTWKADPEADAVHGFIAQEMQEIIPEAVSGDPDGEEMMSMDYGRITPVLVAALQDAHKKIEALEERLAELEAK